MPQPTLFISHSSRTIESQARLRAFVTAFEAVGMKVEYDRRDIPYGETWRRGLARMLATCDCAVLILDQAASQSPYVLYEINVLMNRQLAGHGAFRLLVAKLEEILSWKTIDESFKAADLSNQEIWRPGAECLSDLALAQAFARDVAYLLPPPDPFGDERSKILLKLRRHLANATPSAALSDAIEAADLETEPEFDGLRHMPGDRSAGIVSVWLIQHLATAPLKARRLLGELVSLATALPHAEIRDLVGAAESFWIEPELNCGLRHALTPEPAAGGCFTVNGGFVPTYTLRALIYRAVTTRKIDFIRCGAYCASPDEVLAEIRKHFQDRNESVAEAANDHEAMDTIRTLSQDLTVCVLPPSMLGGVADTLPFEDLRSTFPSIVYVVDAGPEYKDDRIPRNVAKLAPPISISVEKARRDGWILIDKLFQASRT